VVSADRDLDEIRGMRSDTGLDRRSDISRAVDPASG
jgi:hypothetical protein